MSAKGLVFCVHNHQPVDNFDIVFQETCVQAYEPFINAMERHPSVKFCAHYSGPLLQWIQKNRLDLFIKIRGLVDRGQLELLAGGFYEPPLSMLSENDALGQVAMMVEYLHKNFGIEPKGMWLAERIWEPQLAGLLARTGLKYTILDDAHFRAAGLEASCIHGHFLTEDRGELFRIFPIREKLRYLIPWKDPEETVRELEACPDGSIVTYADDGEKFGGWPETRKHVYEDGWLERFLGLIEGQRTCTFAEALEDPSQGRVYLPTCSYREMGEWSLHPSGQERLLALRERLEKSGEFDEIGPFLTGGTWRNFRAKYPEANLMYGRMVEVSRRVAESKSSKALEELYQAQCNDAYWHGVFGGLYLPSLRDSVYRHLIRAENELGKRLPATELVDLNLDGGEDIRLTNPDLSLFISPYVGAQLLEIDVRKPAVNIGATLSRRFESYHGKLLAKMKETGRGTDFERHLVYDTHPRTSLVEHFFPADAGDPGCADDIGDFAGAPFSGRFARREKQRVATFGRDGTVAGVPVRMEKEVLLPADGAEFQVTYTLRPSKALKARFAVELNFGLLSPEGFGPPEPGAALYFIHDSYHDLQVKVMAAAVAGFGIHPFRTISQSEKDFDLNYQGTAVVPHWDLDLEADRDWRGVVTVKIETPK